ncbi:hypothetical protein [Burkholderia pyrrocinia]|uniref:hypothetical protein n=1 Tax=Burkholderia pyrrocinia TaxID=60550 RepID=UPI0015894FB5|nr:hypothetical protein [Burkholderia pyrrocinia]
MMAPHSAMRDVGRGITPSSTPTRVASAVRLQNGAGERGTPRERAAAQVRADASIDASAVKTERKPRGRRLAGASVAASDGEEIRGGKARVPGVSRTD